MSPTRGTKIILTKWGGGKFQTTGGGPKFGGDRAPGSPLAPPASCHRGPRLGTSSPSSSHSIQPGAPPSESIVSRFRPLVGTVPPGALRVPPPSATEAPASGHPAVLWGRRTASSQSISHSIVSRFPPHVGTPPLLSPKEVLPLSPIYIYARDR